MPAASADLPLLRRPQVELSPPAHGSHRHPVAHHVLPDPAAAQAGQGLAGECLRRGSSSRLPIGVQMLTASALEGTRSPDGIQDPAVVAAGAHLAQPLALRPSGRAPDPEGTGGRSARRCRAG